MENLNQEARKKNGFAARGRPSLPSYFPDFLTHSNGFLDGLRDAIRLAIDLFQLAAFD